jgi:hypothetical protein
MSEVDEARAKVAPPSASTDGGGRSIKPGLDRIVDDDLVGAEARRHRILLD